MSSLTEHGARESGEVDALARGSIAAAISAGVTAAGGLVFWIVAAAVAPDADVGRAAAWFSTVQSAVAVVALGAPILVNRTAGRGALAPVTAGATTTLVVVASLVVGLFTPLVAVDPWRTLSGRSGPVLGLAVGLLVAGAALTLIVDARAISLRRWRFLVGRSVITTTVRVGLLAVPLFADRATWILVAASGPVAMSGLISLLIAVRGGWIRLGPPVLASSDRRFLGAQHLAALAIHLPYPVIPVVVARHVSADLTAAFYLVWSIGVASMILPQVVNQVLLSEMSLDDRSSARRIRSTAAVIVGLGSLGWLIATLVGAPLLGTLGPLYGDLAAVLPWLLAATTCWGLTSVIITELRLAADNAATIGIGALVATIAIAGTAVLVRDRPVWGAPTAWLVAQIVGMVLAVILVDRRATAGASGG